MKNRLYIFLVLAMVSFINISCEEESTFDPITTESESSVLEYNEVLPMSGGNDDEEPIVQGGDDDDSSILEDVSYRKCVD